MTDPTDYIVPPGLADLPLAERQRRGVDWQRDLAEGLTRRYLADATFQRAYAADQFARVLRVGRLEG